MPKCGTTKDLTPRSVFKTQILTYVGVDCVMLQEYQVDIWFEA